MPAHGTRTATAGIGVPEPSPQPVPTFSWSGYIQGIGLLFLVLGILWLGVRLLKQYGRF